MRRPSLTPPRRHLRPAVAAAMAAVLSVGLAGCGSGQLAQTRLETSVIDGINGAVGPILVRYAYVPHPKAGTYKPGESVPLQLTFVNETNQPVTLVGLESPEAQQVAMLRAGQPVPSITVPPRLQTQLVGGVDYSLELRGLTKELRSGSLVAVTFQFDVASGELEIPVQLPQEKPAGAVPPHSG